MYTKYIVHYKKNEEEFKTMEIICNNYSSVDYVDLDNDILELIYDGYIVFMTKEYNDA